MKRVLVSLVFLLLPGLLLAETVNGVLDGINPTSNTVIVNGVAYETNVENVPIYYNERRISPQDLHPGDEVQLVLSDQQGQSVERKIDTIILIRGEIMPAGD